MRRNWLSFAPLALALLLAPAHARAQSVTGSKVGYPDQCTNSETNPTTAEWLTCQQKRAGTTKTNPLYVEPAAGIMPVGNYVWDGTAWQKWRAYLLNQDNLSATSLGAASGSFLLGYDPVGGNWDRVRLSPLAASLAPTNLGLETLSSSYFYDGTNFVRWAGAAAGADNVSNSTSSPWVKNFNMAYDGATWDRVRTYTLSDALGAAPTAVGSTSFTTFYDGTNFRRWKGEDWDSSMSLSTNPSVNAYTTFYDGLAATRWAGRSSGADNVSNVISAPWTSNFNMAYDGSTWDRVTMTAAGDALSSTLAGLTTLSLGTFYDGANYRRWQGSALTDNMDAPAAVPGVGSFLMVWDGSKWDRWSGGPSSVTLGDTMGATPTGAPSASYSTYYDGTNFRRWQGETWDTAIDTVTVAPSTLSLNAFYDSTSSKGYRWTGGALTDNMDAPGSVPGVGSFLMVWDGSKWDRWTGGASTVTLGDSMGATPTGAPSASHTTFYDGTNYRRWLGAVPADNLGTAMAAPYTLSLGTFYDGTNYRRWTGETYDSALTTTVAPATIALNAFYNGSASQYWLGGSLTSSISAPVTAPYVGSIMYGYSSTGPTYYPVKADANGIYTHMADLLPGEDAVNDWRKVRVESVATYTPGYTDTASVAVAATEVLASVEVLGYSNISITCKNTGVTNNITASYLYISANGTDWDLYMTEPYDITPGTTKRVFKITDNSDRYLKVLASANTATTSSRCWLTARVTN